MFYKITSEIDEVDYLEILRELKSYADEIIIVEYPHGTNETLHLKNELAQYHKCTKWITRWPGTTVKTKAKADIFEYNKYVFKTLKKNVSLISEQQEKDIDVFFLKDGECVFYSVIHEDIHVITISELKKVIADKGIQTSKISEFDLKFR